MSGASSEAVFVGGTLAHFRVLEKLGEGGMGVVYRAEDTRLRRPVALKVLPPERSSDPDRRARLLREARAAAVLSHPNIAVVYEVDEADGHGYIAMELVAGRSLRQRLDGPLPVTEALALVRQIAAGLQRAHEAGVVHRDLKPDNVMVDEAGQVKLLDFGLAKLGAPSGSSDEQPTVSTVTEEGRVMGTPGYMSPEQARGGSVDARTDVFAVGVLTYELLTGRRPFAGETPLDVMAAITRDAPRPPTQLVPSVPRALEALVLRCLEKDPARRPPDGSALVAELEALAAPPPAHRSTREPLIAAIVLSVAALAAVAAWLVRRHSARPPESAGAELYRGAKELLRRAETINGTHALEEALRLDPGLAAASLRLALEAPMIGAAREQLARAEKNRASLDEHDGALLDAIRPCVADRDWNWAACAAQLEAAAARWPGDEELAFQQARALANLGLHEKARTRALEAGSPRGLSLASAEAALAGDGATARSDAERCLQESPRGIGCFLSLTSADEALGDCARLLGDARRFTEVDGPAGASWLTLARAQAAAGRPVEEIRASLGERWRHIPEPRRKEAELSDELLLFLYQGDFARADEAARRLHDEIATWPFETEHLKLALHRVQLLEEMGRAADAAAIAEAVDGDRRTRAHAPGNNLWTLANDATPLFLEAQLRGGKLTRAEAARRRDAWLGEVEHRLPAGWMAYLWIAGYAAPAHTPEEALEALAALPRFSPLPPRAALLGDGEIGRVYLLAERAADALPRLEHAASTCRSLDQPVEEMRARLALGEARAAGGDKSGACADYAVVEARWGAARPSSVTAQSARTRARALGCP